jgi:signal transduction histidine kinase
MNDQSEFYGARGQHVNGRAPRAGLVGHGINVAATKMFLQEDASGPQFWPLLSGGQELGAQNNRNNEFLTVFSHELRNSLGAISSATHVLRIEVPAGPAAVQARLVIERQVGQMTRLIEDLLDVSRVRSGQMTLRCERIDLCVVAAHAAQTVEFIMQQRNHRMTTSFPNAPVWVHADPVRIEQVFVNLLINAAKYTDSGGHVDLAVEQEAGEAVVRIVDTGLGIDPDVLPHIFDLFVQANPSSRRADAGLGIGLARVRSLVQRQGGRVTATSAGSGRGSEFTVRLPVPAQ